MIQSATGMRPFASRTRQRYRSLSREIRRSLSVHDAQWPAYGPRPLTTSGHDVSRMSSSSIIERCALTYATCALVLIDRTCLAVLVARSGASRAVSHVWTTGDLSDSRDVRPVHTPAPRTTRVLASRVYSFAHVNQFCESDPKANSRRIGVQHHVSRRFARDVGKRVLRRVVLRRRDQYVCVRAILRLVVGKRKVGEKQGIDVCAGMGLP
jgi:hypothetical protein